MSFAPLTDLPQDGGNIDALVQLIYRSVSTTRVTSALEMSDILAEARARNAQLGVTGVLTAVDGQFVQIIEGPEAGINLLLAKLMLDRRHTAVRVLQRRQIAERDFGEWEMVSPRLAGFEAAQIALLLSVQADEIDQYAPVFKAAILRQDAVLEGMESPASIDQGPSSPSHAAVSDVTDKDA